jgi:hypothetical protein
MAESDGVVATPKPILKGWQSTLLAVVVVSAVYCFVNPPAGDEIEQAEWMWNLAALAIWGSLGACFAGLNWYLIELCRRGRQYIRASREEQDRLSKQPLPSHPVSVLVLSAITALVALCALQNYGWATTVAWTAGIVIAEVFCVGLVEELVVAAIPKRNLLFEELEAAANTSILMGQSARFPTEEDHKRSGKFK